MRQRNKHKKSRHAASIDGMVASSGQLGVQARSVYRPNHGVTPTLDTATRRSDGFHPARQTPGGIAGTAAKTAEREAVLDEPIVLDDMDYERKKHKIQKKIYPSKTKRIFKRTALTLLVL